MDENIKIFQPARKTEKETQLDDGSGGARRGGSDRSQILRRRENNSTP
jgi:hypothetical protein